MASARRFQRSSTVAHLSTRTWNASTQRTHRIATSVGEELPGRGVNSHAAYTAFVVQLSVHPLQHSLICWPHPFGRK